VKEVYIKLRDGTAVERLSIISNFFTIFGISIAASFAPKLTLDDSISIEAYLDILVAIAFTITGMFFIAGFLMLLAFGFKEMTGNNRTASFFINAIGIFFVFTASFELIRYTVTYIKSVVL